MDDSSPPQGFAKPGASISLMALAHWGEVALTGSGTTTARLDAEILLCHAMEMDRTRLIAHFDEPAPAHAVDRFAELIGRRALKEPVAYITGIKEFYSLPFHVNRSVLIPRPETELVVDEALAFAGAESALSVLDIGAGSGAIAVAVAANRPRWKMDAVDLSVDALAVARENARMNGVAGRVTFMVSDLFYSIGDKIYDLILSNPPYIADDSEDVASDVRLYEPHSALFAGHDGMDVIDTLVRQSPSRLKPGGRLIFEMDASQAERVRRLIEETRELRFIRIVRDYAGLDRVAVAERI